MSTSYIKRTAEELRSSYSVNEARGCYRIGFNPASIGYFCYDVAAGRGDLFARAKSLREARKIVSGWIRYDRERFAALQLAERAAVRVGERIARRFGERKVNTKHGRAFVSYNPADARTWSAARPISFAIVRTTADNLWSQASVSSYTPQRENAAFLVSMKSALKGGAK